MIRNTHAPDSHQCKPLPWFFLFRRRLWTIQETAGATIEWQLERRCRNSRRAGRVRRSHGLSYDRSMLEYKVVKFPTLTVFYDVRHCYEQEDTRSWQWLMEIIILILPPEATTVNNPSDSRRDSGVTAGVTLILPLEGITVNNTSDIRSNSGVTTGVTV